MDDEEKVKRQASDLIDQLIKHNESADAKSAEAAAAVESIKLDFEREMKAQLEKVRQLNKERDMAEENSSKNTGSLNFLDFIRPVLFTLAAICFTLTIMLASKPDFMAVLLDNPLASSLGVTSVVAFACFAFVNFLQGRNRRDSFVEIDDRLFDKSAIQGEVENSVLRSKVQRLEDKYLDLISRNLKDLDDDSHLTEDESKKDTDVIADRNGFERYMSELTGYLETHINVSEKKASLLLDKGTTYLWRGIVFYILSIVVWQVVTTMFKVGEFAVWGMVSCSLTFLVVEFLAAWFLRQYKSYTDASFNLVRVKSVFNRYYLSYLVIKEFSSSSEDVAAMRAQMLKVIEEDIKWLEPAPQKMGELNHMVAMFEAVSGLVEKIKFPSKGSNSATAP